MAFRIDYDDDQLVIMGKIMEELNSIGIPVEFKDDGLEHDGFMIFKAVKNENPDIVISLISKNGYIHGPSTKILVKNGNELKPIGCVQEICLGANSLKADMLITFPLDIEGSSGMSKEIRESIKESSSLLAKKGCKIILK
jgi:hypothetical protein